MVGNSHIEEEIEIEASQEDSMDAEFLASQPDALMGHAPPAKQVLYTLCCT